MIALSVKKENSCPYSIHYTGTPVFLSNGIMNMSEIPWSNYIKLHNITDAFEHWKYPAF